MMFQYKSVINVIIMINVVVSDQCNYVRMYINIYLCYTCRILIVSLLALLPLLCGTWILGLLFLIDSDSEPVAWIFTIINSLQVRMYVATYINMFYYNTCFNMNV